MDARRSYFWCALRSASNIPNDSCWRCDGAIRSNRDRSGSGRLRDRVACIDRRPALGGTCLNIGCIPSKALLDSSEYYALAKSRLANHGIQFAELKLNLQQMMQRKDRVVKGLTDGVAFLLRKHHVTVVQGTARLSGAQRVSVRGSDGAESMLEAA